MLMAAERTRLGRAAAGAAGDDPLAAGARPSRPSTRCSSSSRPSLLDHALREDWRIERPRIGLCALNPHASDGGLFGTEEAQTFVPAVSLAAQRGRGRRRAPCPADTVFSRALAGEFDAVVAPYHDVGMAAFKTVSFGTGVNVTLGLPIVRTSPDHGTAFDIAGTGRADESSMLEALRLADAARDRAL